MDNNSWPRTQMLPSLFKSEPAQITLRPLIAPSGLHHHSPLQHTHSDIVHYQHQTHHDPSQSQHALLPRAASVFANHIDSGRTASPAYHQHDTGVPIKMESESSSAHDYRRYHQHSSHRHQQQLQHGTSLPVLADMLRASARLGLTQHEMGSSSNANSLLLGSPAATTPKSALSFILGSGARQAPTANVSTAATSAQHTPKPETHDQHLESFRASTSSSTASSFLSEDDELAMNRYMDKHQRDIPEQTPRESDHHRLKATSKRRAARPASRTCKFDGCDQYVVDHGLCVRHGGGKRCVTDGCTSRAKHFGRCWRHGGSMECKIPDCVNRAKSRGFCWSHGGGTKCKAEPCEKIAISNGLCWAHGGGKRCVMDGCTKQAYERTQNYCNSHYQQWKKHSGVASARVES